MEAGSNGTARASRVRYTECDWGELIEGTKEQLQALGLGIGLAFPGEVGGPRTELKARDPRGHPVTISNHYHSEGRYTARIEFSNWPKKPNSYAQWAPHTTGVKKREYTWFDEYIGNAQDLAAAGLVQIDQLPGKPGMRKTRVTILADGSVPSAPPTANIRGSKEPGARWIERASSTTYRMRVVVTEEERSRREARELASESAWIRQVRALARPARLAPMAPQRQADIREAQSRAASDVRFQGMLARIVASAVRPQA